MAQITSHPPDPEANQGLLASRRGFSVVGLGASAGGGAALELFLETMPADSGMAFVAVTPLLPPPPQHCRRHFAARQPDAGAAGKRPRAGTGQPRLPLHAAQAPCPCTDPDASPDAGVAA